MRVVTLNYGVDVVSTHLLGTYGYSRCGVRGVLYLRALTTWVFPWQHYQPCITEG